MKKILITGSSGFIGTNLMKKLIDEKFYSILGIDIQPPRIESHNEFMKKVDITDEVKLTEVIEDFNPNFIIHLAARTDLNGKSLLEYSANIKGVEALLNVVKGLKNIERVIFTSSMYVCVPGYIPLDKNDYKPHTIYGESKVISEELIKKFDKDYKWSIVRPTSIWGPWFDEPYKNFFDVILANRYFHMGPKACSKTYGFIDNVLDQVLSLLVCSSDQMDEETFYLGDKDPYNITNWADEIAHLSGKKILTIPFIIFRLAALFGDFLGFFKISFLMTSFRLRNMTTDNVYDLSKIHKISGEDKVLRIDGIKSTLNWLLKKRNECI
jgi:GlcNAc-P-P-Und epimerase